MKKLFRILGALLFIAVLAVIGLITYVTQSLPNIDVPKDLKVERTPERVKRGQYLANHVCVCMDCHSTRDWNTYAAPPEPGTAGIGGEVFDQTLQFPGRFVSRNITPYGLKDWSDGEIYRAITSGMSRDGHPFFPVMPYPNYNKLATEDVYSIIAYLRSLPELQSTPGASKADFPVNIIMHTIPEAPHPQPLPKPTDPGYGDYMTNACGCKVCHTKMVKGKAVGEPFAGGFEFNMPNGAVARSVNITPSTNGGIGKWSKEQFIARFKTYCDSSYVPPAIDWSKGDVQTVMPWMMYCGMTGQDLGSIYDYLRTVKAVDGAIERWTPPAAAVAAK